MTTTGIARNKKNPLAYLGVSEAATRPLRIGNSLTKTDRVDTTTWNNVGWLEWQMSVNRTEFNNCIAKAYELIEKSSYENPTTFKEKRVCRQKRVFRYEAVSQPIDFTESWFRFDFFTTMVDAVI